MATPQESVINTTTTNNGTTDGDIDAEQWHHMEAELATLNTKLEAYDATMNAKLDAMEADYVTINAKLDTMEADHATMNAKLDAMKRTLHQTIEDVALLQTCTNFIKTRMKTQSTLFTNMNYFPYLADLPAV